MAPLAWIRRIVSEIPELNAIPLFGNAPPFHWEQFSLALASRFGTSHCEVRFREQLWREAQEIKKGLGTNLLVLPIAISPVGTVFWISSREDMIRLTSWIMKPGNKARALSSEILQEGFYRYLILEALNILQEMQPFQDLTLQLSEEEESFGKAFCIDVEIHVENKSCWGRLAIPEEFHAAWVQHFSQMPSEYVPAEIARQTELVASVKTGSVTLRQDEWESIDAGDFIILDQDSYDARQEAGIAILMLQSTPLFNVKIKHNQMELIDYAFYYEDTMQQNQEPPREQAERFPAAPGEAVSLKELPLYVTVEIARFKITLDQLMHLSPGNTLELPVHPDQGVSLTVNGQMIGRAELVYLGEQLGIRILEM